LVKVVTRQVRKKWQFGRILENDDIYWYRGDYASEKHAHRAAENRVAGYKYNDHRS
jgi:hypothetical protein